MTVNVNEPFSIMIHQLVQLT